MPRGVGFDDSCNRPISYNKIEYPKYLEKKIKQVKNIIISSDNLKHAF